MKGTVYDKLRVLKDELSQEFDTIDDKRLFKISGKLASWHYPNKRTKSMKLSKEEAMIYEFLITKNYNPSTVYKWMLACNTNEDTLKRIQAGTISLKEAMRKSRPYKGLSQAEQELMYQIKLSVQKYIIR